MKIIKAIKRLGWRFEDATKRNNTFTVNQNDLDALNRIAEYIEETQKQIIQDNHLFAKLFLNVFKNEFIKSEGNYQYNIDMMRLVLKKPLDWHYKDMFEEMNEIEFIKFAKSKGLNFKHSALLDEQEIKKQSELLKEHQNELIKHLEHFKEDAVYQRTNELLNKLIQDFKNN